jgi:hypothetical protein
MVLQVTQYTTLMALQVNLFAVTPTMYQSEMQSHLVTELRQCASWAEENQDTHENIHPSASSSTINNTQTLESEHGFL